MTADLASLAEAAEALAAAARSGNIRDALRLTECSRLAAVTAFGPHSLAGQCWSVITEDAEAAIGQAATTGVAA